MSIEWLIKRIKENSERNAIVWRNQTYKYEVIISLFDQWCNVLEKGKFKKLKSVALDCDYSPNSCALMLALINKCKIIVPITKASIAHKDDFMRIANVELLFTFDEYDNCSTTITGNCIKNPLLKDITASEEPGLVLFSSGSTGKPKGALHRFNLMLEKFKVVRKRMCILNFLLFDHIGGLNTLFYTISNSGTAIIAENRDPEYICRLIEKYKIELLPTTPTFLNLLLLSGAYDNYDCSSLKLITYGTEVMPENVLIKLLTIFPNVRLQQTYGLSEIGILRSKSKDSSSLWVKIGGEDFETKVVDKILWIRANSAMIGYLNAPSPFTEDGWFITGDEVDIDGEYIRILGRRSEIINVGGEKVYPTEVESIIQTMQGVHDVTVTGEKNFLLGQIVKATVVLSEDAKRIDFRNRLIKHCSDKLSKYKIPQKIVITDNKLYSSRYKKMRKIDYDLIGENVQ